MEYCRNQPGFFNGCGQFSECTFNALDDSNICVHDSAFDMNPGLWVTYLIMPIFVGISMLGGLGGGILKGPFMVVILNYTQTMATHISYCLMFGGTFLNTGLLIFEKKPDEPNRPIINFWIAVIFNLSIPFGATLGSSTLAFLPQLYIVIIQEIFLISVAPILWKKGFCKHQQLANQQKQQEKQQKLMNQQNQQLNKVADAATTSEVLEDRLYTKFQQESEQKFPLIPLSLIGSCFCINQLIIQMISTSSYESFVGLKNCSVGNYMMMLLLVGVNLILAYFVWTFGRRRELLQDAVKFNTKERYFTPMSRFLKIYAGGFAAGFIAGAFGIGAGLILIPVLLSCGLNARCASATSAFNNFMISLNNLITLLTNDYLGWQVIVLFTSIALIGGSVFTKIGYFFLNYYKIGYMVIFFVFYLAIGNILSQLYYGVVTGERYGMGLLTQFNQSC